MEKTRKKKTNDPLAFERISLLIKEFVEPIVMYTLYHEILKTNVDFEIGDEIKPVPIIVGGSAVDAWLKSSPENTKTKDFDIRLVYPTTSYDQNWRLSESDHVQIMEMAEDLANKLVKELNSYISSHQNEMFRLFEYYNLKVTQEVVNSIKEKRFFSMILVPNNLFMCQYTIETQNFTGMESVIDIFPISNNFNPLPHQLENFRSNPVMHDNSFMYPIPTVLFFGVYFAALGYCIWDLINIISYNLIPAKLQRNQIKLQQLIRVLNRPQENLNCRMTEELIENCQKEIEGGCTFGGRILKNVEIINYGTRKNLFPDQAGRMDDIRGWLGDEYLCDYIKRYQDRIFIV